MACNQVFLQSALPRNTKFPNCSRPSKKKKKDADEPAAGSESALAGDGEKPPEEDGAQAQAEGGEAADGEKPVAEEEPKEEKKKSKPKVKSNTPKKPKPNK